MSGPSRAGLKEGSMSDAIAALMRTGTQARREKRLPQAHQAMLEAVALARASGTKRQLIEALKGLGQIERDLDRGGTAAPLYEEAVALCRDEGDLLLLAHTIRHLGDIIGMPARRASP